MKDFDRYLPHTQEDIQKMLDAIFVGNLDDLFDAIPKEYKLSKPLNLPEPLSEPDLIHHFQGLQSPMMSSFLGAGAYHHFIPAVVYEADHPIQSVSVSWLFA